MEKWTPYISVIIGLCVLYGIITTIIGFQKNEMLFNKEKSGLSSYSQKKTGNWTQEKYLFIISRNIFNIAGTIPDSNESSVSLCPVTSPITTLPYKIQGIIYGGSDQGSIVIFESKNETEKNIYTVGDKLPQGGILSSIQKDKILITNKNCPEYLALDYGMPNLKIKRTAGGSGSASYKEDGFERNGTNIVVTRQWMDNLLNNNFNNVLEEARATPNIVAGQVKGFNLTNIIPDSVYAKMGLQNGDIVSSINGVELTDAARAVQTLNALRNEKKIEFHLLRNGQPVTFTVNVQ